MKTNSIAPNYKGFRFPPEIISHAVVLDIRVAEPTQQKGC
jgi:putative transposase